MRCWARTTSGVIGRAPYPWRINRLAGDFAGQAEQRRHLLGGLVRIGLDPAADITDFTDQGADDRGIALGERARREVELMVADQPLAVAQGARLQLRLGGGLERIPDHPGIDAAALEGGAGIGWRQVHRLDVAVLQPRRFQRADQQVVHIGALVQRDLLVLELGHRADRRVLRHQDRLATGRRRLMGDVEQIGTGGLGEHRRGFTGHAEVDGADVEPFQQLRTTRELRPLNVEALPGKPLLQRATGLEQHQRAVFLVADP